MDLSGGFKVDRETEPVEQERDREGDGTRGSTKDLTDPGNEE